MSKHKKHSKDGSDYGPGIHYEVRITKGRAGIAPTGTIWTKLLYLPSAKGVVESLAHEGVEATIDRVQTKTRRSR